MRRTHVPTLVALFALLGCSDPQVPPANVLLLSIDCLNQRQFEGAIEASIVPTLARIAGDSMVFERAYAHSPWTNPSHMSMLTGLYPSQHGRDVPFGLMADYNDAFDRAPTFETLPQMLAEAGYTTAAFVGGGPTAANFGLGQGFDHFVETSKNEESTDLPGTLDAIYGWLESRQQDPFFLFVHTFDFHSPFPKRHNAQTKAIIYVDSLLAELVARLDERGLYESTLIIVTGDHGSKMIATDGKCCLHGAGHYEENLKVPLLVKMPGNTHRGTSRRIARHVDLLPTVLDVVGVRRSSYDGPGEPLLRLFTGTSQSEGLSFSEADGRCAKRFGLVTESHKYIYTPRGMDQALLRADRRFRDPRCWRCAELPPVEELFDLTSDPFEQDDLLKGAAGHGHDELLASFRRSLEEHLNLRRHYKLSPPGSLPGEELLPEQREQLRTLGYVN